MATTSVTRITETPHGEARVHLHPAAHPPGALVLGHGAGGGVEAPDLVAATAAAGAQGFSVALVEQPYRVAGKRSSPAAKQLDAAWIAVAEDLMAGEFAGVRLVAGGRSAGARVACRTAAETGASAVLCLAFPLHAPGRSDAGNTRQHELDAVRLPVLVVQGASDPFGMPAGGAGRDVVVVPGTHSLSGDLGAVAAAVREWLGLVLPSR
jgi:uncharacterized protein